MKIIVTSSLEFLAAKFETTPADIVKHISEGNESLMISLSKLLKIGIAQLEQIQAGQEMNLPEEVPLGLTDLQINQECYVNMYKDRYGFKPRNTAPENWKSVEWLDSAIAELRKIPIN